ncbi:MAG: glycosyltransferase [Microcoleaceae cyanobacterium]
MALISVIIPVYNAQKTIQATIESVLQQTFPDFELIIINDGSTDQTDSILRQYTDSRISIYTNSRQGAAVSRNQGFQQSNGEYIAFLDADDLWTVDKLESQLKALKDHPEMTVSYSWTDYIDEAGNKLYSGSYLALNGDIYSKLLVRNFLENGSNPMIKRQALIDIGGFDESLEGGQDWDLYLRLAAKYQFIAVPTVQIYYRVSSGSISSNLSRQEQQVLKVMERNYAQSNAEIQPLKSYSLTNLYKYLTCRALALPPSYSNGLKALQFSIKYAWYEPDKIAQFSLILVLFFKSLFRSLFPNLEKPILTVVKKLKY